VEAVEVIPLAALEALVAVALVVAQGLLAALTPAAVVVVLVMHLSVVQQQALAAPVL
jgi:hypothetical protein